jgi:Putative zinc-finger
MRNELEIMQQIERYLDGELPPEERAAFEKQLAEDPGVREDLRLQQQLMSGIARAAWKDKVQQASRRYVRRQRFWKGGTGGFIVLVAVVALVWRPWVREGHPKRDIPPEAARMLDTTRKPDTAHPAGAVILSGTVTPSGTITPPGTATAPGFVDSAGSTSTPQNVLRDNVRTTFDDVDTHLQPEIFRIEATRDTVVETKGGIVFSIPAGAFLLDDGQAAVGGIQLVVREALDPATIFRAGLSTLSGGQLLESGGMFSVNASKDGKALRMDPARGVYAEIPTDTVKPGMQLYSGKRIADGTIDWVDPQPLEHDLVAVDIQALDFYPHPYLDSLRSWGYDSRNKAFTDSLYYSFAQLFGPQATETTITAQVSPADPNRKVGWDTVYTSDSTVPGRRDLPCNINPAKIKTIWNKQFQNTLLATREFEERMRWIHRTGSGAIFDLYVSHLDRDLSDIDSMAAKLLTREGKKMLSEKFRYFYDRKDGKVRNGSRQFQQLRDYYQQKEKLFTEAAIQTEREFRATQAEADRRRQAHQEDSVSRAYWNYRQEMAFNLTRVCRQLGYDQALAARPPARYVYRARLSLLGWCNLDRAVGTATRDQVTTRIVDAQTGKSADIIYSPLTIQVSGSEGYDRVSVYLLPEKLSSFIRLSGDKKKCEGKLNDGMKYNLVCIAFKKDQAFYHYESHIGAGDHPPLTLDMIGSSELDRQLNLVCRGSQAADLQKENDWFRFEFTDRTRQENWDKVNALRCRVMRLLFPCLVLKETGCQIIV